MRRLQRPQYRVPTLRDDGSGGRRRVSDCQQYEISGTAPKLFPEHWNRADVKGLLRAMQGRVCAYCESELNGEDVEHFRPKATPEDDPAHGGYWWLAYEPSNYFLSCPTCNRIRKRTSFPLLPGAIRCEYDTRDQINDEKRVLLDPGNDPVEDLLTIGAEDIDARLIPVPDLGADQLSKVQQTIDLLGLNLNPVIRSERSKAYEHAAHAAAEGRWDDLQHAAMRHRPHSLAARIILQRVAPDFMPTAEQEVKDLISSIWLELRRLVEEVRDLRMRSGRVRPLDEREVDILIWALIALANDPGIGQNMNVDAYLGDLLAREKADLRAAILQFFMRVKEASSPRQG